MKFFKRVWCFVFGHRAGTKWVKPLGYAKLSKGDFLMKCVDCGKEWWEDAEYNGF